MMMSKKKETIGRQKIPMVKIKKESHRQVTFSKRRAGLFKKASELCTLCGAEIGIIVFSPAKKPFSFGHPSVESLLDRYLSRNNISLAQTQQPQGNSAAGCELNMQLTQILSEVEDEKKKGQAMEEIRKASVRRSVINWWEKPVEEMNMFQLQEMKHALEELRKTVVTNMASFSEVKEDVFGFLDNKVTAPPYMNMSAGLSSIYNFANGNGCF
ncbi:PREDICTED: agamous-like MADS-box protein AGL61 [Camelina sativa]|uniref:Agamous-like MADS-box protein AGL61 n=1 Tax=Camelina sativa TaxID=90675 RepID=A0ABM0SWR9_CAMSA|nr:PREDICTED: agamous-like MADS-box protein AGL61 [Camelina sativa]XP_010417245.2 PREDICTED: agamous-like MADS-box protein AGL61 [Camelina sativa]